MPLAAHRSFQWTGALAQAPDWVTRRARVSDDFLHILDESGEELTVKPGYWVVELPNREILVVSRNMYVAIFDPPSDSPAGDPEKVFDGPDLFDEIEPGSRHDEYEPDPHNAAIEGANL